MTAVYYANVKFDTNTAAVIAEMIEDGFAPDVAEWLALFIPSIPGAHVGRRLKLVIDDAPDAFTVEEIKKLFSVAVEPRRLVEVYRNSSNRAAVAIDDEWFYAINENGEAVELQ